MLNLFDGVSNYTYYLSGKKFDETPDEDIVNWFELEGLITFLTDKRYCSIGVYQDRKDQPVLTVNLVIGEDETLYVDATSFMNIKI